MRVRKWLKKMYIHKTTPPSIICALESGSGTAHRHVDSALCAHPIEALSAFKCENNSDLVADIIVTLKFSVTIMFLKIL